MQERKILTVRVTLEQMSFLTQKSLDEDMSIAGILRQYIQKDMKTHTKSLHNTNNMVACPHSEL